MNDPALKKCPTCRSKVTKLISASAFTLKGGGWYSDAYQKKSGTPATGSSDSTSSSTSSESTPSTSPASTSD
jgi:predicted nucleic acid-binding Zn ribbon protein